MSSALVEQFSVLLKMCKGASTHDPVCKALEQPGLFVFGELVNSQSLQQLRGTEHELLLRTMELFAYGTWTDYRASPSSFLKLNEKQATKLKQLTLCTLASKSKILPYSQLLNSLELEGVRALEDFIIQQCMYSDILKCKLDQLNACVYVQSVLERDVQPTELGNLVTSLEEMLQAIGSVGEALVQNVTSMSEAHTVSKSAEADFNNRLNEAKMNVKKIEAMRRDQSGEDGGITDASAIPTSPGAAFGFLGVRGSRVARASLPDAKRRR